MFTLTMREPGNLKYSLKRECICNFLSGLYVSSLSTTLKLRGSAKLVSGIVVLFPQMCVQSYVKTIDVGKHLINYGLKIIG